MVNVKINREVVERAMNKNKKLKLNVRFKSNNEMSEEKEGRLKMGNEDYVELLSNDKSQCSLMSTINDDKILYIVEDHGNLSIGSDFNVALEGYIKASFCNINGESSAYSD